MIGLLIFGIVCFVVAAILIPVLIVKTKNAKRDTRKMVSVGPSISLLSKKAKNILKEKGFSESAHDYSTAGYEYYQYKTVYHYEDNLHLVIDTVSKQIAYFQYVPFNVDSTKNYTDFQFFKIHKFSDIIKIDLLDSRGTIVSNTVGGGVGTSVMGVGVGVGTATTVSQQYVKSITVTIFFRDGEEAGVNFLNNQSCLLGGDLYNIKLTEAKKLYALLESYISEEKEKKDHEVDNISKVKKLKELMDDGIITNDEFEAKKKELLDL